MWQWFLELSNARSNAGLAPSPVTWPDISAWARLRRVSPTAYELDCLRDLDAVYLSASARKDNDTGRNKIQP